VKPSAATVWAGNSPNGDARHAAKLFIRPRFPEILVPAAEARFMMLSLNPEVNDTAPRRTIPAPRMSFTAFPALFLPSRH
jgi:hypothetical protein